ncbi:unnamed protein product [Rhizophagus irregularis]|nr:unnamed protein product [Rhizophagus irregularis]
MRENECVICGPIRLPQEIFNQLHFMPDPQISSDPDHYQDFNSLYGRNTTEIDLPSKKKSNFVCQELASDGILVAARVRDFALCTSCTKLRCIFSKYVLRESDSEILQTAMETFAYTCGSPIVPENHIILKLLKIVQRSKSQHESLTQTEKNLGTSLPYILRSALY